MSDADRRRVVPTLFIAGGVLFAFSSVRNDVELFAQLFGLGTGLLAAGYGAFRLRQERRRPPDDPPDDEPAGPGAAAG